MKTVRNVWIAYIVILVVAVTIIVAQGKSDRLADIRQTSGVATWTMTSKIVTNELDEATYNVRTNGYIKVEEQGRHWANNIIWVGHGQTVALLSCMTNTIYNGWASVNQNVANAPDPFKDKVTIKYFTEEREDTYTLHVGPLDTDFATVKTVLKRWRTKHVQKISQHETNETITE